jgi:hypothetical protein
MLYFFAGFQCSGAYVQRTQPVPYLLPINVLEAISILRLALVASASL